MHNLHKDYEKLDESLRHPSKYPGYVSILQDPEVYPFAADPAEDLPGAEGPLLMRNGFVRELLLNCASKQNVFDDEFATATQAQLHKWGRSDEIHLICVSTKFPDLGNPYYEPDPAFSAGEDLVGLYENRKNEAELVKNLQSGYRLIGTVANMRKPTMMVVNGAAIGAGASMAFFGNMAAVEETSVAAFPACSLGLAPGFGASYFLNRYTTPAFGMMLALTGKRLKYWDLLHCGLATTALHFSDIPYLAKAMADGQGERGLGMLMTGISNYEPENYGPYTLGPYVDLIERCFADKDSVEEICEALKGEEMHFAHYLLRKILDNCPISVKVAFRLMKDAEQRELNIDYLCEQELAADEHRFVDTLGLSPETADRRPYDGVWKPPNAFTEENYHTASAFAQQPATGAAGGAAVPSVDSILDSLSQIAATAAAQQRAHSNEAFPRFDDEEIELDDLAESLEADPSWLSEPVLPQNSLDFEAVSDARRLGNADAARLAALPKEERDAELSRILSSIGTPASITDEWDISDSDDDNQHEEVSPRILPAANRSEQHQKALENALRQDFETTDSLNASRDTIDDFSADEIYDDDSRIARDAEEEAAAAAPTPEKYSPIEEEYRRALESEPPCYTDYHDSKPEKLFTESNTIPVEEQEAPSDEIASEWENISRPDTSMFEVKTRVRQALLPERGAHLLGLQKCFEAEYRANLRLVQGPEFAEAVEKRVLGNGKPDWRIKRLRDVPDQLVNDIVAPFSDPNDELPRMNPYSHKGANLRSHLRDFYKMRHITGPSERDLMFYAERHMFGGKLSG